MNLFSIKNINYKKSSSKTNLSLIYCQKKSNHFDHCFFVDYLPVYPTASTFLLSLKDKFDPTWYCHENCHHL